VESTLADSYRDLTGEVGFHLGYGRGTDNGDVEWTTDQLQKIKSIVKSGLRQFYFPPPDQTGYSHSWSFLKPRKQLVLSDGELAIRLPDDFQELDGPVLVVTETNLGTGPTRLPLSGQVRAMHAAYPDETGRPRFCELEPLKGTDVTRGQRFQLAFFPTADDDYTVEIKYTISGEMLSGELPYAYGGVAHAETLLESCLAIAEERVDDIAGVHSQKFARLLASSISRDRTRQPQHLGYNGDRSDGLEAGYGLNRWNGGWPRIEINGFVPGDE
jgi:hypothetical protein